VFAGAAYDLGGSYDLAFTVFVGTYLLAAVLIMLTPRPVPPAQNQRAAVGVAGAAGAATSDRLVARGGGSM